MGGVSNGSPRWDAAHMNEAVCDCIGYGMASEYSQNKKIKRLSCSRPVRGPQRGTEKNLYKRPAAETCARKLT